MDKSTDKTPSGTEEQNSPKPQQKREISVATINAINTVGDEPGESKTFIGDTKESYDNRYIGDTPEDIDGREITMNEIKKHRMNFLRSEAKAFHDLEGEISPMPGYSQDSLTMVEDIEHWASIYHDRMEEAGYDAMRVGCDRSEIKRIQGLSRGTIEAASGVLFEKRREALSNAIHESDYSEEKKAELDAKMAAFDEAIDNCFVGKDERSDLKDREKFEVL